MKIGEFFKSAILRHEPLAYEYEFYKNNEKLDIINDFNLDDYIIKRFTVSEISKVVKFELV